jgi:hypothetical protein
MIRITLLLQVVLVAISQAQINKWPGNVEQLSTPSCVPYTTCTDTVGALYRHFIDAYTDKVSVYQGDSIGVYIGTKADSLSGLNDTIRVYRYGVSGWVLMDTSIAHSLRDLCPRVTISGQNHEGRGTNSTGPRHC